jgi:hypothetical protein
MNCNKQVVTMTKFFNDGHMVRNLQDLADIGWSLQTIQPVKMFPQAHHLETVVLLEKSGAGQ